MQGSAWRRSISRKVTISVSIVSLFGICANLYANEAITDLEADDWEILFDGQSLAAFRNYNKNDVNKRWQIEGDALVLTGRGGGDLITRKQWQDFELMLEWRIEAGGNSGVFFLADESELPIFVHAPEIQILDNERHRDRKKANRRSGSLYDMIAAPASAQKPAEQWNQLHIRFVDRQLQVTQNGVQAYSITLNSAAWDELVAASKFSDWAGFGDNLSGHIGLQDHGDRVSFRNIKIRDLSDAP